VDNDDVAFSEGCTDLHARSYEEIVAGRGFGLDEVRSSIDIVSAFRRMNSAPPIGRGASIGANATIVCGHMPGEYCFIGAGAAVTKDVPALALMAGNPAQRMG
jgi:acetyltransferase-like isoleucine patch superfamily enzyme